MFIMDIYFMPDIAYKWILIFSNKIMHYMLSYNLLLQIHMLNLLTYYQDISYNYLLTHYYNIILHNTHNLMYFNNSQYAVLYIFKHHNLYNY